MLHRKPRAPTGLFAVFIVLILLLTGCSPAVPEVVSTPEYLSINNIYLGSFNVDSSLEAELGYTFPVQLFYLAWGSLFNSSPFSLLEKKGVIGLATWEFHQSLNGPQDPYVLKPLQAVIDGRHDDYVRKFAQDARAFGKPLFLRWGHEMNGDWYQWSGSANGGSHSSDFGDPAAADGPERFVAAYRHIHAIFDQEGASNVIWVWCPNIVMQGELGADWNAIANYYPGNEIVDWLCMDGYNWGGSQSWSSWQSFEQVFGETYAQLQAINASKPIMIGETASTEKGGDKAAWVADAFSRLDKDYPQVRLLVWFNINKETDWRINSTAPSLEAFRQGISQYPWGKVPWPGIDTP